MATANVHNGFTGDWMEYMDHIDAMNFASGDATSVSYDISSEEDDPAVAGLDGGRLVLSGSGFVVSGASASGGTISVISFYSGLSGTPLLFDISGLSLKLDTFNVIVAAGDLDEFLALATDYVGHDHGDDHGDDGNEADDEDEDDSVSDDSDDYYEDNGSVKDNRHGGSGDDDYFSGGGDDSLHGGSGNDDLYGESGADKLYGDDDSDELYGGSGSDDLYGGSGLDYLYGGSGSDLLDGGSSNDHLLGGSGNDTYRVNSTGDRVYETVTTNSGTGNAGGTDTVECSVSFSLDAYVGVRFVENLRLTSSAAINGTGNNLNNHILGGTGNNIIDGRGGDDLLRGGKGNDTLSGGSGKDNFRFDTSLSTSSSKNLDKITDFSVSDDTIQLDNAIFAKLALGGLSAGQFKTLGKSSGSSSDDYILYNKVSGALLYDADGGSDGNADAVQFATIGSNLSLTNADFMVI